MTINAATSRSIHPFTIAYIRPAYNRLALSGYNQPTTRGFLPHHPQQNPPPTLFQHSPNSSSDPECIYSPHSYRLIPPTPPPVEQSTSPVLPATSTIRPPPWPAEIPSQNAPSVIARAVDGGAAARTARGHPRLERIPVGRARRDRGVRRGDRAAQTRHRATLSEVRKRERGRARQEHRASLFFFLLLLLLSPVPRGSTRVSLRFNVFVLIVFLC